MNSALGMLAVPVIMAMMLMTVPVVNGLDNGLARTPPMGWISWAKFFCETDCVRHPLTCISEKLYMDMADRMAEDGYAEAGYTQVNIDDCWMEKQRDESGTLIADHSRFAHGIKWLANYMHSKGLKLGIYEDYGTETCGGYPGSLNHLQKDANTFAEWNVDMLKLDGCNVNISMMHIGYPDMSKYVMNTGAKIVYSCEWPLYTFRVQGKAGTIEDYMQIAKFCNLWRNYDDIYVSWKSISGIIDYYVRHQDVLIPVNGPGQWNDPDMIVVGNSELSLDQSEAQLAIWSIWSAPLFMSNDLRWIPDGYKKILLNKKVIAVDQDPLGIMGKCIANETNVYTFVKAMTPYIASKKVYSYAVAFLNKNLNQSVTVSVQLSRIGLTFEQGYHVEDLYKGTDHGLMKPTDTFSCHVNPTGVCLIKASINNRQHPRLQSGYISA